MQLKLIIELDNKLNVILISLADDLQVVWLKHIMQVNV